MIEISGGTYFPGAKSASDSTTSGPYFLEFAKRAQKLTDKPLMVTGGFKTLTQAVDAISGGGADLIGLARALVLDPELPNHWLAGQSGNPVFPKFPAPPEGGITAWYTMRLTQLAQNRDMDELPDLDTTLKIYNDRDEGRAIHWNDRFKK